MTIKKDKVLNQWLDKQFKAGLIVELSSQYMAPCFYISKKGQKIEPTYNKGQNTTTLNWKSNKQVKKDKIL